MTWDVREHVALAAYVTRWTLLAAPLGLVAGSTVAVFLWALELATRTRNAVSWLLWLLPLAGLLIGALYHRVGKAVEGGNNLIVDEIHEPGGGVPGRMAPLVLVATVITHLFGGSAGREGTAVQMGGSIASALGRRFGLDAISTRTFLTAGIAAGFGAVFGTPITGAVFALEVLAIGRVDYEALVPCLVASLVGDWTCQAWGIHHTAFHVASLRSAGITHLDPALMGKVALAAAAFGMVSAAFSELTHGIGHAAKRAIPMAMLRPVVGGAIIIALTYALGTRDYLGLGVTSPDVHGVSIISSFQTGGVTPWSWAWKLVFTAVTLGFGFKGGEVTPLFFIGAALGNVLGGLLGAPTDLFAALGFVAVFAGATNTPLACTIMGMELFGADAAAYIAAACFLAFLFSGHSGIYLSQRIGMSKGATSHVPVGHGVSLRSVRDARREGGRTRAASSTRHRREKAGHAPASVPTSYLPAPNGGSIVPHRHEVRPRAVGHLRIYLAAHDRRPRRGIRDLLHGRSLYTEIIDTAKKDGIPHAVAHTMLYGYTSGPMQQAHPEYANAGLTLCVELIGPTNLLDLFIRKHGDLLQGRMIVHKDAEHWDIYPRDAHELPDMGELE